MSCYGFKCFNCEKVCETERGRTRHMDSRICQPENNNGNQRHNKQYCLRLPSTASVKRSASCQLPPDPRPTLKKRRVRNSSEDLFHSATAKRQTLFHRREPMGDDAEEENCGDTLLAMEEVHHDTKMLADHKKHLEEIANNFAPVSLSQKR